MRILKRIDPNAKLPVDAWNMNAPLLSVSGDSHDRWTIADACEHTFIFGGTGSGKTSGSAATVARAFLLARFGGLVMCAKPGEASQWESYARACSRSASIVRVDASGRWRFNFLDYLLHLPAELGGGLVDNVVHTLMHIFQVSLGTAAAQSEQPDFFMKAVRQLLSMGISALYHAYGQVRLDDLIKLINSVPTSETQASDAGFQTWSFCYSAMRRVFERPTIALPLREAANIVNYFGQLFGRLDSRTRTNIVITLSAEISLFMQGPLHTLFCTDTNFIPEITHDGAIVIVDLPIKRYEHIGHIAQMLFKYIWQKAAERRAVNEGTRPIFLFADEAQFFSSPYDIEFMSTARSSRAAVVYATQNLPSLYARIGGRNPQDQADAMLGNFQTKIFHANTEHRTNQWAADLIGRGVQRRSNRSWSHNQSNQSSRTHGRNVGEQEGESSGRNWGRGGGGSLDARGNSSVSYNVNSGSQYGTSKSRSKGESLSYGTSSGHSDTDGAGWSEQMDYVIQPSDFSNKLRQGGERNGLIVTGILVQANRSFSRTGSCWSPVAFKQNDLGKAA